MAAMTHELALRYLLELSTDIRVALLLDPDGGLLAAAPDAPNEQVARLGRDLAREAAELAPGDGGTPLEVDVTVNGGAVFLVRDGGQTLLCVTGRFALPGLILHDLRMALSDIDRGGAGDSSS
jgi:hypothetical protein